MCDIVCAMCSKEQVFLNQCYVEDPLFIDVSMYCCVPDIFTILLPIDFSLYYIQDSPCGVFAEYHDLTCPYFCYVIPNGHFRVGF